MHSPKIFILVFLGILGVALAFAALFPTAPPDVPKFLSQLGSAVGMSAGVAQNPYNAAAEQLQSKEVVLNEREAELQREAEALNAARTAADDRRFSYVLLGGIGLAALVGLNFFLDYRRRLKKSAVVSSGSSQTNLPPQ